MNLFQSHSGLEGIEKRSALIDGIRRFKMEMKPRSSSLTPIFCLVFSEKFNMENRKLMNLEIYEEENSFLPERIHQRCKTKILELAIAFSITG